MFIVPKSKWTKKLVFIVFSACKQNLGASLIWRKELEVFLFMFNWLFICHFKIFVNVPCGTSSDNEWQWVTTSSTTSDCKWQRVTMNDNKWQRVVLIFPAKILLLQPSCWNWWYCKLVTMKFFRFSLTFFCQLLLKEGIFGTAASLIPYFLKGFIIK